MAQGLFLCLLCPFLSVLECDVGHNGVGFGEKNPTIYVRGIYERNVSGVSEYPERRGFTCF